MQIDPQDFEKLLKKQKSDPNAFPMVSQVPHRKSLQFVVNPPMKEIQQNAFPVNVGEINQSCFMKLITSGIISIPMGAAFGFFFGCLSQMSSPMLNPNGMVGDSKVTVLQDLKRSARFVYLKGKSSARTMAVFGAAYSGMGCVIERVLGVKSIWTNALAGCSIGLAFGAKRGPASACMSCAGYALFGILIDMFMF